MVKDSSIYRIYIALKKYSDIIYAKPFAKIYIALDKVYIYLLKYVLI